MLEPGGGGGGAGGRGVLIKILEVMLGTGRNFVKESKSKSYKFKGSKRPRSFNTGENLNHMK